MIEQQEEALTGDAEEEEETMENGDVHSRPVRALDALTHNDAVELTVVCAVPCRGLVRRVVTLTTCSYSSHGLLAEWTEMCPALIVAPVRNIRPNLRPNIAATRVIALICRQECDAVVQ